MGAGVFQACKSSTVFCTTCEATFAPTYLNTFHDPCWILKPPYEHILSTIHEEPPQTTGHS